MFRIDGKFFTEARNYENKWSQPSWGGLLEGIEDDWTRKVTAVLLENQHLYCESLPGTGSADVSVFKKIAVPLVRRIYPQLIANRIVTVQPLLSSTGLVYYLRYRYSSDKGKTLGYTTQKNNANGYPGDDSVSLQQTSDGTANLDTFYTSQFIDREPVRTTAGVSTHSAATGTVGALKLEHFPVISNGVVADGGHVTDLGGVITAGNKYTAFGTVRLYDASTAISSTVYFGIKGTGSGTVVTTETSAVNETVVIGNPATGLLIAGIVLSDLSTDPDITLTVTNGAASDTAEIDISYEYDMECNDDIPEVNLTVEAEEIGVKKRMMKATWSYEADQDLRSMHDIEAETELTAVLAQEINMEIDREILRDLRVNAGTISTWDFGNALGNNIQEKYQALFVKLTEVSNIVHRKTLRGGANWIVTTPEVASIFEAALSNYQVSGIQDSFTSGIGVSYVGNVQNRWQLFKDPLAPANQILMGYRGQTFLDTGYFYCPYVPLMQTPTIFNDQTLCPLKGIMTRYGKKMLRDGPKFYARVQVRGLQNILGG